MTDSKRDTDDPFCRLDYRRMIAWQPRIEREWPFLWEHISRGPVPSVLDVGCGTGEHARFAASQGIRAVGIDRSEKQIAAARDYEGEHGEHGPTYLQADVAELGQHTTEKFGSAICLGNVIPYFEDEELAVVLKALHDQLLPGAPLIAQLLNYERIQAKNIRNLPLNFREAPEVDGEIVFVRMMRPDGDDHVAFFPTSLHLRPGVDPPVEVRSAKEVRVRAWRWDQLASLLKSAGFQDVAVYGDVKGNPFEPRDSNDIVFVAYRDQMR